MFKRNVVIKHKKVNPLNINFKKMIFFVLFFSGVIVGCFSIKNSESSLIDLLKDYFISYITEVSNKDFLVCFLDSLLIFILPTIFIFIFGLCAVGIPIIIATPVIIGIFSGMAISFLFFTYSLQGIGYSALIIIPSITIIIATLLKSCEEAFIMSSEIIINMSGYQNSKRKNELKDYCLRFLIFTIPVILSALLNVSSQKIFSGLFSFI